MSCVLVSGASGIVGYGVLRSLRQSGIVGTLIGTSIYGDSVAPAFCDIFEQAPVTSDLGYMTWLIEILRRHQVNMLIPGIEIDMQTWAGHLESITEAGAFPLVNKPGLVELCKDKWQFYCSLKKAGIQCAIESSLDRDFGFLAHKFSVPYLLKPRRGFGSKGIVKVNTREEHETFLPLIGISLMAQPIVGSDDQEYTTSAFCDGRGGWFACMTLRRKLSKDGFTEKAEVVDSDLFLPAMRQLCHLLQPVGPTNFQFRLCEQGVKLLEINPRISSSTSIRAAFGYNESAMAVNYFLNHQVPAQPAIRRGRAVRYMDEQLFYEDSVHI